MYSLVFLVLITAFKKDYVISEASTLKPSLELATVQVHGSPLFKNVRREVNTEMASGSSGNGICSSSLEVDLFSALANTLDTAAISCSGAGLGTHFTYTVEYEDSGGSSVSFNIETMDESVLFADHFSLEESYKATVKAMCGSCDSPEYDLTLDITVRAYTDRLFPYGSLMSDEELTGVDDGYADVHIDAPFSVPIYEKKHRKLYMNSNGLVTFEKPNVNWNPAPFPYGKTQVPTLAPYWTDLDLSHSSLYYSTYYSSEGKRAQNLLTLASSRVSEYAKMDFTGQWMLIGTWSEVQPYSSKSQDDEELTFQVMLISDFSSSYVLYLYDEFSFVKLNTDLTIGHTAADFKTYYNVEFDSSNSSLNMDTETGNTGETGQWMFNLTTSTSSEDTAVTKCSQWAGKQSNTSWTNGLPPCPCSRQQANNDWRYSFAQSERSDCAVYVPASRQSTVECCYDDQGALATGLVESGSYLYYHPAFHPDDHKESDSDPYEFCCKESENCQVFRLYRPSVNCSAYAAPDQSFGWGDPHFETLDGTSFTFNGVGEFVLLSSSTNKLSIQIRLEQYKSTNASVITAIALKHKKSPIIQFEASEDPGFVLYLNGKNESDLLPGHGELTVIADSAVYDSSSLSSVDLKNENNVFIVNDNNTYLVSIASGAVVRIGLELTFLYCGLELAGSEFLQDIEGLVGFYDSDPTNDFRLPDGTTASDDLTEEELYTDFGLKWHLEEEEDSIFFYHGSMQYSDFNSQTQSFSPSFGIGRLNNNPTLKSQAEAQCDGDYSCLYDTAQTGDLEVGLATHEIRIFNKKVEDELGNLPPNITGSSFSLIVTAGVQLVAIYTASDPDTGTSTEITLQEPIPEGVELNSTGHLLLNITSLPSLSLYLTSSDSNDTTKSKQITILLCDCKNNGTCIEDSAFLPLDSNGHYRLPCDCKTGFGGEYCENNLMGCGQHPCPSFTTCETDSSSAHGYRCVDCESGYQYNSEDKCVDKEECANATLNPCSQVCVNTVGSYQCSCNKGYRLRDDGAMCEDIDECTESLDDCSQLCTNTEGGYSCECLEHWILSDNNCEKQNIVDCDGVCDGECSATDVTKYKCICPYGKKVEFTSCKNCTEGKYGFECMKTCNCTNGGTCEASAGCTCPVGYTGYDCGTEINNFPPVFLSGSVKSIKLPEALPAGTPLLYLLASDEDLGVGGKVTYAVVAPSYDLPANLSDSSEVFTINATSGLLSTAIALAAHEGGEYLLEVEAKDGATDSKKATHLLYIEVVNTSLPRPVFSSSSYQETLYENKTTGSEVLTTLSCMEEDSINEELVDLRIEIVSGNVNSSFEVVNNKVKTAMDLDYETVKMFKLQLSCTNYFNNTALVNATILLLNINDNPFKFEESFYSVEIFENATSGASLLSLLASDADHPESQVEYFFNNNKFTDIFKLNKTTGMLSVASVSPFDREERDNYTLEVVAYLLDDDNDIQQTVSTSVLVTINDVNDYIPLFDESLYILTNLSQSNEFGDTVLFVSAVDKDLGSNGEFIFSIQNNSNFDIDPKTGEVFVNTTFLDRGTYVLSIYATDLGNPPLTGTSVIDIYVKPTPTEIYFTKHKYVFNVSEGAGSGKLVGTVEATLFDVLNISIDSELEYSFMDDSGLPFFLDPESGEIIVYSILDYEDQGNYEFKISASFPGNSSVPTKSILVEVVITDSNDNSPIFSPSTYSELVYDDIEIGSTIVTVHASDKDHDGNQPITYAIEEDFGGPFEINSTSGDILVSDDLGLPQDYHFTVMATDSGEPVLSDEAVVYVSVARRSVVHPLLSKAKFVFDVSESVESANTLVGMITALIEGNITITKDHGIGFRLKEPGYEASVSIPFNIDSTTGEVTTIAHSFNYEQQEAFVFYVELYDLSNSTKVYDTAPVVVKVLDVNDNEPSFQQQFYSGFVSETANSGTTVLQVSANDFDSGKNSELVYSLTSSHLGFHIDPYSGVVTLVNSTQVPGDYKLTVTATDQGNPQNSATVDLDITIIPVNQNISFSLTNYSFSVLEGSSIGTNVGDIVVTDVNGDTFSYDDLTFKIYPLNDCIGNDGRSIKVTCGVLDREKQAVYMLSMSVIDSTLTGVVGVRVDIEDVNDAEPLFDKDIYTTVISSDYNVTNSGPVVSPIVTDGDADGMITFTIKTSNSLISELFHIDPSTGEVTLLTDTPPVGDYSFQIVANDSIHSTLATVLISVFKPGPKTLEFKPSSLLHSVPENSPGGTEIGGLELLAPEPVDLGDHIGNLKFAVLSGEGASYFHVFDHNGSLALLNDFLDREKADSHVILVEATFEDYKLSTKEYVTIKVTDRNDNAPKFTKNVYSTSIASDSEIGTSVVTVRASDMDIGINANVSYSFQNKSESYFNIDADSGLVTTSAVLEDDVHYKLIVVAADGGSPQLTSTCVVSVLAEVPRPESISFVSETFEFQFTENNNPGSHVGTVSIAEDTQFLEGLVFSFVTPTDTDVAADLDLFHLDAVSGNISALSSIDREKVDGVEATVTAKVPSDPSLSTSATVKIKILDENDNTPTFEKSIYTDATLTEGSISTKQTILTVIAVDNDEDENGDVEYELSDEGDSSHFTISSSSGDIKASSSGLESGYYHITVLASDGGSPSLTGTTEVLITVYAPLPDGISFEKDAFIFQISEDTTPGTMISNSSLKLKPVDMQFVSILQYTTNNEGFILVGNNTKPTMYSSISFDYDTSPISYEIIITATAHLTGANVDTVSTIATVTVNLTDVNDNSPVFENLPASGKYDADVTEGTGSNTLIISLSASDQDSGSYGSVKFSLVDTFGGRFKISDSGQVRTGNTKTDREQSPEYLLTVEAKDGGNPSHTTTTLVHVVILDINDESPKLISGNVYHVLEEQPPNAVLFTLTAVDLDEGSNGIVIYTLVGGDKDFFWVNSSSGEVHSTVKLDYEESKQEKAYNLTLSLSNAGEVSNSVTETITVNVINVPNDNRPYFTDTIYTASVSAIAKTDDIIVHFNVIDNDGDSLAFEVNRTEFKVDDQGVLRKASDEALEPGNKIPILIRVTDSSEYRLSAERVVIVTVVPFISHTTTTSSSTSRSSSPTPRPSTAPDVSGVGGTGLIGFGLAGVFGVLFVLAIVVVIVLAVLGTRKRRERVKEKDPDPYAKAEENWVLGSQSNAGVKKSKKSGKKAKGKKENIEMEQIDDSSAYGTMYGDDLEGFLQNAPWMDQNYQADSEDNHSELASSGLTDLFNKGKRPHSTASSIGDVGGVPLSRKGLSKPGPPSLSRPGNVPSKGPMVSKPSPGTKAVPSLSKPKQDKQGPPNLARPILTKPNPQIPKSNPSKSTSTSATSAKPVLAKPSTSKTPLKTTTTTTTKPSSSNPAKPTPRKSTSSSAPKSTSGAKNKASGARVAATKSEATKPTKKKGTASSSKPDSKQTTPSIISPLTQDGPEKGASRRKRRSIDSSASELDNQEYLSSSYGSAAPMMPGERPSEYDMFINSDNIKPGRKSVRDIGWSKP